ncbi:MAG TPA: amidohydrolase family protein [Gemmatimonadota bacterium]|nr:amidohydrolase family protein [Gemmatimonadota bacterium]
MIPVSLLILALTRPPAPAPPLAIVHATVVPMDAERTLERYTILVQDGRIAWLGPDSSAEIPSEARVIDATAKWVLPGLADMHVHSGAGDFPAFVANGVTTIREMNGAGEHLELRNAVREGRVLGPSMIVTGPLIAGEEQRWRHAMARTPDDGRALVAEQARLGFDAVKIYDGLTRETYDAIVEASAAAGIQFVGHVPRGVGLERVLESGQRSIEHAGQIAHAVASTDSAALAEVGRRIARSGAWVTPTLASEEALSRRGTPWFAERLARPEVMLVDPGLVDWWRSLGEGMPETAAAERRRAYREGTAALVRALLDAGVPLLAGTDTPNPLMIPGFSLHEELAALVAAGLTPYEAIRGATAEAGRFADMEAEFGTIRVGARADLVLTDADPLADVSSLARPTAVVLRGEWLPRERLDGLLGEALAEVGAESR